MQYESEYYGVTELGDSLMHHGVKGQKHGTRRWQYEDGSLTPAGRIHYGVGEARDKARTDKKPAKFSEWAKDQAKHNPSFSSVRLATEGIAKDIEKAMSIISGRKDTDKDKKALGTVSNDIMDRTLKGDLVPIKKGKIDEVINKYGTEEEKKALGINSNSSSPKFKNLTMEAARDIASIHSMSELDSAMKHYKLPKDKWREVADEARRMVKEEKVKSMADAEKAYNEKKRIKDALKDATTSNIDKWGTDPDHNILYVTGLSGSGKSTAALNVADKKTDVVHLDMYYEEMDEDTKATYQSKALNTFLDKKGIAFRKINDGSLRGEANAKKRQKLIDQFQNAVDEFGKSQYGKGRRVVMEGVEIVDNLSETGKQRLRDKPLAIMDTGTVKSTWRAMQRDDVKIYDLPTIAIRYNAQKKYWAKPLSELRKEMANTAKQRNTESRAKALKASGKTNAEIADLLGVSPSTVSEYLH